jgi:hypothetical protein
MSAPRGKAANTIFDCTGAALDMGDEWLQSGTGQCRHTEYFNFRRTHLRQCAIQQVGFV